MDSFIKKDLLVFWRDRKEILVSLFLPIILIVLLNVAFSGIFSDNNDIQLNIALVQEDDEATGIEQFEQLIQEIEISDTEKEGIIAQSTNIAPVEMVHTFVHNPDMKEWITITELSEQKAIEQVENEELDAILKIPSGFTYDVLSSALLGEQAETSLKILAMEESKEVTALQEVVGNFVHSINMQFALGSTGDLAHVEPVLPQGGKEVVEGMDSYTMVQYFTIAIGTLFPLFLAQTVAMKTVTEKRERVFNRIMLTNSKPMHYLIGKTAATFIIVWLQVMITFLLIQLLLDVFPGKSLVFWVGIIVIITAFTIMISGLSALFTSMSLYIQDSNAASGLFMIIVMTLGVLGGSFFPLDGLPQFIQNVGEWTPNGLTHTAVIEWIQFNNWSDLWLPLMTLISFFVVCFIIAVMIFPKRGRI